MPEPFKNFFNEQIIRGMSVHFKKHDADFQPKHFIRDAMNNFETLELKQRSEQIKQAMITHLPQNFERAAQVMLASLSPDLGDDLSSGTVDKNHIAGWAVMPMADYVAARGMANFDLSMTVLKAMTRCSSSEFAIRFFILAETQKTLKTLNAWTAHESQHVRRLVSEGSRPRLPWAMQLPLFIEDPQPVITLLEKLKDDEAEYVRRSVANNLNDIAKDHPDLVADIAERWMVNASKERQKLVRHACRTLLKQGHKKTLKVLGFDTPKISNVSLSITTPRVDFGNYLQFSLSLQSTLKKPQPLMIDYIIHHNKANGKLTAKVFKWKTVTLPSQKIISASKNHAIKQITTRVYYPGTHKIEVMINGTIMCDGVFELIK